MARAMETTQDPLASRKDIRAGLRQKPRLIEVEISGRITSIPLAALLKRTAAHKAPIFSFKRFMKAVKSRGPTNARFKFIWPEFTVRNQKDFETALTIWQLHPGNTAKDSPFKLRALEGDDEEPVNDDPMISSGGYPPLPSNPDPPKHLLLRIISAKEHKEAVQFAWQSLFGGTKFSEDNLEWTKLEKELHQLEFLPREMKLVLKYVDLDAGSTLTVKTRTTLYGVLVAFKRHFDCSVCGLYLEDRAEGDQGNRLSIPDFMTPKRGKNGIPHDRGEVQYMRTIVDLTGPETDEMEPGSTGST
ncbi:uncharacterized protein PV07_12592 [Cladophialophora immunda]|uniref:Uncharacterized protein n=1 Tax=Cladophialophora immunda TaxID=569365 RepID=A0A0D2AB98_9EURO|nr:uncharacterized protein PV07_12592 [Cladophialophora immunda]KIW22007.1 hypothetical protein PV07_12592 [Cladophialophora immunda]